MWTHYCKAHKAWLSNLIGEPCIWCDCTEDDSNSVEALRWGALSSPHVNTPKPNTAGLPNSATANALTCHGGEGSTQGRGTLPVCWTG